MRQTHVLLKFVVALSTLVALSAFAGSGDTSAEQREAQAWLNKIQTAAQRLNYSGTFVYQQGNQVRTSRITHLIDGKNETEKLEILDGKPREYIRNNEEIICYVPEAKTLVVEKRVTHDIFPAILAASPSDLAQTYQIRNGEAGRVAGHDCQSIVLEPKDNLRYGYKLWAEKSSGLLLRAQTLNEKHEIVEQISFTHIAIGNVDRSRVKSSFVNTNGWRVENALTSQASLSGWTVKSLPPGFKKIREVNRLVSDQPAAASSGAAGAQGNHAPATQREVSQIVFSDGLAAISVFIEPGTQSRTEGFMQQGAMNIMGKRQGDFWLTIVGEVPSAAIKQVANSIEFSPK
ncbi:MucB/RseB C-terminal domain-containing protein [Noviherbaspirillum massiliense]|uniref:MucB/RseB C-terminal domain-containing protein n=1 Tax=Noviherbaspirillum massiliense TaxID=1465823 RepID=UPI00036BD07F|nr:MucB/RseB C-terminal domain-containing protein [Noviherbaspirillum massiliense]